MRRIHSVPMYLMIPFSRGNIHFGNNALSQYIMNRKPHMTLLGS